VRSRHSRRATACSYPASAPAGAAASARRPATADTSLYKVPEQLSDEQVLFLADILPTAYEVGVLNGNVTPGDTVAIVGAGPIGLAAILAAKLYTPGRIVAIDLEPARLTEAIRFGADVTIDNGREDANARMLELTDGLGADIAIEAVGVPATFELCTELVRPGGRIASVGVHGRPATLHPEKLWIKDITITTGLVETNTTPRLLQLIVDGRLDPPYSRRIASSSARPRRRTRCSPPQEQTTRSRSC